MSRHSADIPDPIWKWGQRKSGKTNPASFFRELLWTSYVSDVGGDSVSPETISSPIVDVDPWESVDLAYDGGIDGPNSEFAKARANFSTAFGGDEKSIEWFKNAPSKGIRSNRAFLMSWWNNQKPKVAS